MDSLETMACALVASMLRGRATKAELDARERGGDVELACDVRDRYEAAAVLVEAILADLPRVDAIGSRGPMP